MVKKSSFYVVWDDSIQLLTPVTLDKNLFFLEDNSNVSIDGTTSSKVFQLSAGSQVFIRGLNIVCGTDNDGRCIENNGNLILENVIFHDLYSGQGSSVLNSSGATLEIRGEVEFK